MGLVLIVAVVIDCLQQKLGELSQWSDNIRSCEPALTTSNGLFAVTCSYFHHSVLPELDCICEQSYEFVAAHSIAEAQQFITELEQFIQVFMLFCYVVVVYSYYREGLTTYRSTSLVVPLKSLISKNKRLWSNACQLCFYVQNTHIYIYQFILKVGQIRKPKFIDKF